MKKEMVHYTPFVILNTIPFKRIYPYVQFTENYWWGENMNHFELGWVDLEPNSLPQSYEVVQ